MQGAGISMEQRLLPHSLGSLKQPQQLSDLDSLFINISHGTASLHQITIDQKG